MKTLLLMRHAKSSWKNLTVEDHDRPLNKRGNREALQAGEFLRASDLVPDSIVSSSSLRAQSTASLVVENCGRQVFVSIDPRIYLADQGTLITVIQACSSVAQRLLIIGHNPGLEQLVEKLTGEYRELPTTALAHISLPISDWDELKHFTEGTLVGLWHPKK
tara:strand:+ start:691 stop:1176 length:486 start_codon:yes stop_codon:yes gene_type:complete